MRFLRKTRPRRRRAPQPGPGGQVARLSETIVAFACLFPCGIETVIAFAGAGRASIETAIAFADAGRASIETTIAFAGEKWVFLVHFSGAEVMPVSRLPCWGRAVVLLVSTSPRCRASCVKKVRPAPSDVGVSAKKFAPRAHNGSNLAFSGMLGEFFRGNAAGGAVLGEFFPRQSALRPGLVGDVTHEARCDGGFAALGTGCRRVAGVSHP